MGDRSTVWYFILLGGFAVLRVLELIVSRQHQMRLLAEGGWRVAEPGYPFMVVVHGGLFVGSGVETWLLRRPFLPLLGWSMLALLGVCLAGRAWVWRSLGEQWNTQIVAAVRPIVATGPYRYVRHPNYTIVIAEMVALPLVHCAYLTAVVCSLLNALVLWRRIQAEERMLFGQPEYLRAMARKPRFLPALRRGP
ncbi:MAG: hypothetical protein HYZ50_24755 [Deltaproteobacteria bacterium]|nr:hypothetical protein [Deltaproteobacteria bacterium]